MDTSTPLEISNSSSSAAGAASSITHLDLTKIQSDWREVFMQHSLNAVSRLKCTKKNVLKKWKAAIGVDASSSVEHAFYDHLVDNILNAQVTDFDGSLNTVWQNVQKVATDKSQCILVSYQFALKSDHDSRSCQTLQEYALLLACQQSINAFMEWNYLHFDAFQVNLCTSHSATPVTTVSMEPK